MEQHKISKLLNDSTLSKFVKKNNESKQIIYQYSVNKKLRFKTSMLRSDLGDYSNAYIVVVKGTITVEGRDGNK